MGATALDEAGTELLFDLSAEVDEPPGPSKRQRYRQICRAGIGRNIRRPTRTIRHAHQDQWAAWGHAY